jgi:hypothetical protein
VTTSDLTTEIVACAERTLAERSARMAFRMDVHVSPLGDRGRGGLVLKVAGAGIGRLMNRAARGVGRGAIAGGIIQPTARRFMADYGHLAFLTVDGRSWRGAPGSPIAKLEPEDHATSGDALWLLDVVRGVTDATPDGRENVRGWPCRKVAATVDLGRASAETEGGLCPPTVQRFEELLALPLTVWIDEERVRRVRFEQTGEPFQATYTVELWDFDVPTGHVDWTRLPDNG